MAYLIQLKTHNNQRGSLTVLEDNSIPFKIKRIFYIYDVDDSIRGGHRHHKTIQAAICLAGSCIITNHDGNAKEKYTLDSPEKCLILEPKDWHSMHDFSKGAILLVLASHYFDPDDYIYKPYDE